MARPLRLAFPGGLYHVTARGNGRQPIFEDDADRERFLMVFGSAITRHHMKEVAESLGLHYATVSRILSRGAGRTPGPGMLDFKT